MQHRRRFDWNRFDRALDAAMILMWLTGLGVIAGVLVVAAIAGCSANKPTVPDVADVRLVNVAPASVSAARQSIALLFQTCPEFAQYKSDIVPASMRAEYTHVAEAATLGLDYRTRSYGWRGYLEVTLTIKNWNTSTPPGNLAWGNTLYFYLGGGQHPGVEIVKPFEDDAPDGVGVCGVTSHPPRGTNFLIPVAGMSVVDSIR